MAELNQEVINGRFQKGPRFGNGAFGEIFMGTLLG
jgi:hypothetical protein